MIQLTKILEDLLIDMTEDKTPLSPKEEEIAKRLKPAFKKMKDKYGETKGKEYFYGHIRNLAKKTK